MEEIMKKLLIALMAVALVMGFAMSAAAADEESAACLNCKCPLWNINCGITLGQGDPCCTYFDWDFQLGQYSSPHELVAWACMSNVDLSKIDVLGPVHEREITGVGSLLGRNCRMIFDVCECEDPEEFLEDGNTVGFRFTITTGNGVYFMGDEIFVKTFTSLEFACSDNYPQHTQYFNCDPEAEGSKASPDTGKLIYLTTPGSTGSAVTDCTKILTKDRFMDLKNVCEPTTAEAARIKQICTATDNGYVIELPANEGTNYWLFNVPAMYYVKSEIVPGQTVKVLVELVTGKGGVCPTCDDVCACEIEVGIMCCDDTLMGGCIYFPYVIGKDANWATGIALTNLGGVSIADMEATVTFTDQYGNTLSKKLTDFDKSIVTWVLDEDTFDDLGMGSLASGPMMMKIETNFPADGYEFVLLGGFGGSTMARPCGYAIEWAMKSWLYDMLSPLMNAGF